MDLDDFKKQFHNLEELKLGEFIDDDEFRKRVADLVENFNNTKHLVSFSHSEYIDFLKSKQFIDEKLEQEKSGKQDEADSDSSDESSIEAEQSTTSEMFEIEDSKGNEDMVSEKFLTSTFALESVKRMSNTKNKLKIFKKVKKNKTKTSNRKTITTNQDEDVKPNQTPTQQNSNNQKSQQPKLKDIMQNERRPVYFKGTFTFSIFHFLSFVFKKRSNPNYA